MAERLFDVFPPGSRELWLEQVRKDLKGKDPERLRKPNDAGIDVFPVMTSEDIGAGGGYRVKGAADWATGHVVTARQADAVASLVAESGQTGLDVLHIVLDYRLQWGNKLPLSLPHLFRAGYGFHAETPAALDRVLDQLTEQGPALYWEGGLSAFPVFAALTWYQREKQQPLKGGIGLNPLQWRMNFPGVGLDAAISKAFWQDCASAVKYCQRHLPDFRVLNIDVRPLPIYEGSAVEELGVALAQFVLCFEALEPFGFQLEALLPATYFQFPVGTDFFVEIAKFRAFRHLLEKVLAAYKLPASAAGKVSVQAFGSMEGQSPLDPHANMLRSTTASIAAILGGADQVSLYPHDNLINAPTGFANRTAWNIQHLLRHEAYLNQVEDPLSGAWYVEYLSRELVERGYAHFLKVMDANEGFPAGGRDGGVDPFWLNIIPGTHSGEALETGKKVLIGVNKYAREGEDLFQWELFGLSEEAKAGLSERDAGLPEPVAPGGEVFAAMDAPEGERVEQLGNALQPDSSFKFLNREQDAVHPSGPSIEEPVSWSEDFVSDQDGRFIAIRLTAELYKQAHGDYPKAYLCTFGDVRFRLARAGFARNFLGAAGFRTIERSQPDQDDALMAELEKEAPVVVVLCSSNPDYLGKGASLLAKMREAFPDTIFLLAGKDDSLDGLTEAGISQFLYLGMNLFEYGRELYALLGIEIQE